MYEVFDDFYKQVCEKLMDYLNRILIFGLCKRTILGRDLTLFNFNEQKNTWIKSSWFRMVYVDLITNSLVVAPVLFRNIMFVQQY